MSDADAAGSFVTGGLIAREVSTAGARHAAHAGRKQDICPNCETPSPGHYCPECGQHAHLKRSIGEVLHEAAHGILHLDGKFWRTLPLLALRPGRLTREYVEGKRACYLAPFAIFLFTVFAMYFTFAMVGPPAGEPDAAGTNAAVAAIGEEMTLDEARSRLDALEAELAEMQAQSDELNDPGAIGGYVSTISLLARTHEALETAIMEAEAAEAATGEPQTVEVEMDLRGVGEQVSSSVAEGDFTLIGGADWLNEPVAKMFEDPENAVYRIKQSAYKFSFLLLPLSLPFVWLLFFWRRDLHLYDHTVFILYSLSFMSLLFIACWLALAAGLISIGWFFAVGTAVPLVHMYAQLKGAYRLGWFGALVRTGLLAMFANVVLLLFALIVVGLGALV